MSHVRIIMTAIIAARVLIVVKGFSSKVTWTAKMNHVSIKVTALNFINPMLLLNDLYTFVLMDQASTHVNLDCPEALKKRLDL